MTKTRYNQSPDPFFVALSHKKIILVKHFSSALPFGAVSRKKFTLVKMFLIHFSYNLDEFDCRLLLFPAKKSFWWKTSYLFQFWTAEWATGRLGPPVTSAAEPACRPAPAQWPTPLPTGARRALPSSSASRAGGPSAPNGTGTKCQPCGKAPCSCRESTSSRRQQGTMTSGPTSSRTIRPSSARRRRKCSTQCICMEIC